MATIKNRLELILDPAQPIPEVCAVVSAITAYHPGAEEDILNGVKKAIEGRLQVLDSQKAERGAE